MIPDRVLAYLNLHDARFERWLHPPALSAQALAEVIHVSGHRVVKSVLVASDEERWLVALPAASLVDWEGLRQALGARSVALCPEWELPLAFPDCELGAEPPFGALYGLPVLMDQALASPGVLVLRAGSRDEALFMPFRELVRLERPRLADFAVLAGQGSVREAGAGGAP